MTLPDLLEARLIKVPLEGVTKDEVIAELVEVMVRARKVNDRAGVLDALYRREARGSTGIGSGVAVPHARHASAGEVLLAVGVAPDGVEFESADDEPVHVVFLLVAPQDRPDLAVQALADVGLLMQVPGVCEKLAAARSAAEVADIVQEAHQIEWATPSEGF